jgi:hypothetical protein
VSLAAYHTGTAIAVRDRVVEVAIQRGSIAAREPTDQIAAADEISQRL